MSDMKIYTIQNGFASYYEIVEQNEIVISFRDTRLHLEVYSDLKDLLSTIYDQYPYHEYFLDFSNIDGIGSTALGIFIQFCINNNKKLYIINCKDIVKKILKILEIEELFRIVER